jgi:hypothetical protein
MVLWGIDMQVTDKMIKSALEAWFGEPVTEPYDEHVDNMRFAIQAAIQAAWVKFDITDETTYPAEGTKCISAIKRNNGEILVKHDLFEFRAFSRSNVIAWMPLPEFKE